MASWAENNDVLEDLLGSRETGEQDPKHAWMAKMP